MKRVVGVRFRPCGKISYFYPGDLELHLDDGVIADTGKGEEFGTVVMPPSALPDELVPEEPAELVRKADERDIELHAELLVVERRARGVFMEKVREHELEMKLVDVECAFEGNRIVFYFSAEGRVDFRELVKDLASELHMRIELRQIGVRDETRMLGGMGTCGRPLCCSLYLRDFAPVTIKMAKSQNLSLNPTKISGCCGRLMCCLRNEAEVYDELSKTLPKRGTVVTTTDGFVGVAVDSNILAQTVRVLVDLDNDEKEMREYGIDQLKFTPGIKRPVRKADQRPVTRSVVATAAKAEARKQAIREAEERAAKAAAGETDGSAGRTADENGDKTGEQSRRRRSRVRRRERNGGEGSETKKSEDAKARSGSQPSGDRSAGNRSNDERTSDVPAAETGDRPRRNRSRRRKPSGTVSSEGSREPRENRETGGNRAPRENREDGTDRGPRTEERTEGANRPRRRRRRRPSGNGGQSVPGDRGGQAGSNGGAS